MLSQARRPLALVLGQELSRLPTAFLLEVGSEQKPHQKKMYTRPRKSEQSLAAQSILSLSGCFANAVIPTYMFVQALIKTVSACLFV
jgi:hypothetical protein